jgi:hypothetical protein
VLLVASATVAVRDGDRTAFTAAGTVPQASAAASSTPRAEPPRPAPVGASRPHPAPRRTGIAAAGIRPDASFVPDRLRVAPLGVDAPVVRESVDDGGALALPEDPRTVGWWGAGAAPGAPLGTIVLAGHVDSEQQGAGALFRLARTPVGARVVLSGPRGDASYAVQARRRFAKDDLPWRDLFRQDVGARLLLVTCGGDFDPATRHYTDNVVVYAVPVPTAT